MSKKLTAEQTAELKREFEAMDADKNGTIDRTELKGMLTKMYGEEATEDVIDEMIRMADANNDGVVSFDEFVKVSTEE